MREPLCTLGPNRRLGFLKTLRPTSAASAAALLAILLLQYRAPAQDTTFSLQVQSQIVVLDVVVTDKAGNVVTNLSQSDFKIYEDGVEQEIRNFERPRNLDALPAVAPKDKYGRDDWGNAPLTMLVIDEMDTPFEETAYSRFEVERYLKSQPTLLKQPTIVLWLNDAGFHPISAFTRDRDALISAVDTHKATFDSKRQRGAAVEQLSSSLSALQQMALFSRGSKGNKQIIWVGRSFPGIDATELNPAERDLMNKAIRSTMDLLMMSRTTVYVIDPTVNADPQPAQVSNVADPDVITPYSTLDPFAMGFSFMSMVQQTGGKYFYGRNDLNNEIENSILRNTSFYTLAYVPSAAVEPGKYRKIDIHLSNPALVVQSKQGYYPSDRPAQMETATTAKDLQFDLHEAAITGMVYNGIGVRIEKCQLDSQKIVTTCNVDVDDNSLTLEPGRNDSQQASVVAVLSALDKNSTMISNNVTKFGLQLPNQIKPNSFTSIPLHVVIPPNTKSVRVVVRDVSGRIGTADLDPSQIKSLTATKLPGKRS